MDTRIVIGAVLTFVVLFFGYQWWATSRRRSEGMRPVPVSERVPAALSQPEVAAPMKTAPPVAEPMPEMPGRTEEEVLQKEPIQQRRIGGQQQPVTDDGLGPAQFGDNLRHPENLFHQPQGAPTMQYSDIESGRAAVQSTPLEGNQQVFSPEFAQNGGALIGNSMFAYDGMQPTDFSSF